MNEKLLQLPASELLQKFGQGSHKPGSGSAAALQGMLSAQLLRTVISLTNDERRRQQYAQHLSELLTIDSALENRLLPDLERLFQKDSEQFGEVFRLRTLRDEHKDDPLSCVSSADEAQSALVPATETPIEVATCCVELARYGLSVFDHGFKAARGDSGVAINSALSAATGCLSIVELNLLSFGADKWTDGIRAQRDALRQEIGELSLEAQKRLAIQVAASERNSWYSREVQSITLAAKGSRSLPYDEIEQYAIRLQRALWRNRNTLWKRDIPQDPYAALDPKVAFKSVGFHVLRPPTLGQFDGPEGVFEVAGTIDQQSRLVSISNQFPNNTQKFTVAHELGHYMLHTQQFLHRDRPIDGSENNEPLSAEERQANKFATYFLMPQKLLTATFLHIFQEVPFRISDATAFAIMSGPSTERTSTALRRRCRTLRGLSRLIAGATSYSGERTTSLSELFGVSTEAMAIRLEELDLVEF